ncbi:MAG: O-antigen ligase family protein [Clostridia bacterium]|nr:O-antigen ligase family protein [Clostridia bacterium]
MIKRITKAAPALLVPLIISVLYVVTMLLLEDNFHYVSEAINEKLFLYGIPTYIVIYVMDDFDEIDTVLSKYCLLILFSYSLAIFLERFYPSYFVETDYQGISYGLLIPFVYYTCRRSRKTTDYFIVGFTMILLIFFGGRGPIICALLTLIYKLFERADENKFLIIIIGVVIFLLLTYYESILGQIVRISEKYDFSGSIIKYYEMGDIFSDSGRNNIQDISKKIIGDYPLFGCGLGADRYYLGKYGFKYGNYPHNMILELCIHYGVIVGAALFITILIGIFKSFANRKRNTGAYIIFEICCLSTGFAVLLFSSSYLTSQLFFAMLAVMLKFRGGKSYEKIRNSDLS